MDCGEEEEDEEKEEEETVVISAKQSMLQHLWFHLIYIYKRD